MSERDADLRAVAMRRLQYRYGGDPDFDRELHELQVLQEELLIQREALIEANTALEMQLTQARALFDDAPVPYLVLDHRGYVLRYNNLAHQHFARRGLRLDGSIFTTRLTHTSGAEFLAALRRCMETGAAQHVEVNLRDPNSNSSLWMLELRLNHVLSSEAVCLVNAHDVTRLRSAESELRVRANSAREDSAVRSRFMARMSHEVRTPLTLINGFIDTILFDAQATIETARERLTVVRRAGQHLLGIVNDVVEFSRIEADEISIQVAPFSPAELIHYAITLFTPAAKERGISLRARLSETHPLPTWLKGDQLRLNQILVNLLSNALKFTPPNGSVTLTAAYRSRNLIISVDDTGRGIPPHELSRIFEPFRQVDSDDGRNAGGAGLGLAISQRVMHMMGGSLFARNRREGGATFTLQVPLPPVFPELLPAEVEDKRLPSTSPANARLLLVEDDPTIQTLLSLVLDQGGLAHDIANNGADALEKLSDTTYNAVLMDIQMPVMDGFEAIRHIRSNPDTLELPVIALTARAMSSGRDEIVKAGFTTYIPKPIDIKHLLQTVRELMGTA